MRSVAWGRSHVRTDAIWVFAATPNVVNITIHMSHFQERQYRYWSSSISQHEIQFLSVKRTSSYPTVSFTPKGNSAYTHVH